MTSLGEETKVMDRKQFADWMTSRQTEIISGIVTWSHYNTKGSVSEEVMMADDLMIQFTSHLLERYHVTKVKALAETGWADYVTESGEVREDR